MNKYIVAFFLICIALVSSGVSQTPPTANDDNIGNFHGSTGHFNVLTNDSSPSGTMSAVIVNAPSQGTLNSVGIGTFNFIAPTNGYTGNITFTYKACLNGTNPAICSNAATVTMNHVNNPPILGNNSGI